MTLGDCAQFTGLKKKVQTNFATALTVLVAYNIVKETKRKYFLMKTDRGRLKELPKSDCKNRCFHEGVKKIIFEGENIR